MRNINTVILILLILLYFVVVNSVVVIESPAPRPAVKDFSVNQIGEKLKFGFTFHNVAGGLENSKIVLGVKAIKAEDKTDPFYEVFQIDWRSLNINNTNEDPSKGRAELILLIPPEMSECKERNTFTFTVYIRDALGNESNVAIYVLHLSDRILI